MDLKLAGKIALITGASKGIGRATAEIMAAEGCNVILVARTAADLKASKSAIVRKASVRVDTMVADLSDSANVERLAHQSRISTFSSTMRARFQGARCSMLMKDAGELPGTSKYSATSTCAAHFMR